jgi:tryptophanyl-tRNA synthetase
MDKLYPMALQIERCVTMNQVRGIFGFTDDTNIGMVAYPSIQAAPSFSECFPFIFQEKNVHCLVPCAIDQDPFFRMTRDVAPRLGKKGLNKPAVIHSRFLPSFTGPKMSSSGNPEETIFVTDTPTDIETKIKKYMLTSRNSDEEHSRLGGDCETDVVFQYLKFFEFDEEKLESIRVDYSSGCLSRKGIKDYLVEVIQKLVSKYAKQRLKVTDQDLQLFLSRRPLLLK